MAKFQYKGNYDQEMYGEKINRFLFWRLISYLRPYSRTFGLALTFLIVAKGIEAYVPIAIGNITQSILTQSTTFSHVVSRCGSIFALLLFGYSLDAWNVFLKNRVGQKALFHLRTEVYQHLQNMNIHYYDKRSVGKLMTRTIHDVDQIQQMFAESIVPLIGSSFLFVSIVVGTFFVDWQVALVIVAILPFVFLLTNHFRVNQRRCYDRIRAIVGSMNGFMQEHLMGASTIRLFGLQKTEKEKFNDLNEDHCEAYIETIHYFAQFFAGIDFVQSLTLISVFGVLVFFADPITGFDAGVYFTFSLYALMLFRPLADLSERYNVIQSATAAAARIFHILDEKIEDPGPEPGEPLSEIESIHFHNVWFAYKNEDWVLKGVSFEIKKGESTALVGMTGAGKTTILSLILRFYEFQKGEILINGLDIRSYSKSALRKQFSIVLQDPEIFSGTIAENIGLYQPNISLEQIESAVDYVYLRERIDQFSDGVQHQLAERGKSLSAGERQLLSMARAVAQGGSVLMLDEATANIDTPTERKIQEALHKILQEKTAIVIAHRLSTIKDVSRILVLHEGVVVESGSHQALLKKGGIYQKLYRLQFEG